MGTQRLADHLREILRHTRLSVLGLAGAVAVDLIPRRSDILLLPIALSVVACSVGGMLGVNGLRKGRIATGLISLAVNVYVGLVVLVLFSNFILVS